MHTFTLTLTGKSLDLFMADLNEIKSTAEHALEAAVRTGDSDAVYTAEKVLGQITECIEKISNSIQ